MFPPGFFAAGYFAPRFFPEAGADVVLLPLVIATRAAATDAASRSAATDSATRSGGIG